MLVSSSQGLFAVAFVARLCGASITPEMQWDPNTISSCIDWYDNDGTQTCEYVRDMFKISSEDFHTWNPSVGLDCKPWYDPVSYCILTKERWASFTSTHTSTTTSTSTSTRVSTHVPSPTAWTALGCYIDDDPAWPVLEKAYSKQGGDPSLTIPSCQSTCWTASVNRTVLYAGVKEGNQCWCGSFVAGQTSRNQTDCNLPCGGDKTEICGGKGRVNVFAPVTTKSPSSSSTMSASTTAATAKATSSSVVNSATHDSGAVKNRAVFPGMFN
ncbi:hypothetical protein V8C35DRAFT_295940 [Trichoderma chlorosporum]